jgi:hypothetical protein
VNNRIVLGATNQTLTHIPMGVATGVTYALEDLRFPIGDANRTIGSGAATVASWTVTSSAVAGVTQSNGRRISTASTTGASLGAPALIVAADGTQELIEVDAISTNSYIEATSSLAGVYPSSSVVYGIQLSCPVPDAWAASEDNHRAQPPVRVTWSYTVNGKKVSIPELVTFGRHSEAADQSLGEVALWLTKAYPDLRSRLPDEGDLETIIKLMALEVRNDLEVRKIKPDLFLIGDKGRALICARVLSHLGELGWAPGQNELARWSEKADGRYKEHLLHLTVGEPGESTALVSNQGTTSTSPDRTSRNFSVRM